MAHGLTGIRWGAPRLALLAWLGAVGHGCHDSRVGAPPDPTSALRVLAEIGREPTGTPLSAIPASLFLQGEALILQPAAGQIWTFSLGGDPIGRIGTAGAGPGEFLQPVAMGAMLDRIWVLDRGRGRVLWFDPGGSLLEESGRPDPVEFEGGFYTGVGEPFVDGSQLLLPVGRDWLREDGMLPAVTLLRGGDGHPPSAILRLPSARPERAVVPHRLGQAVGQGVLREPFPDAPLVRRRPNGTGVVVAERQTNPAGEAARAQISSVGLMGDTLFRAEVRFPPRPLDDALVDSILRARFPFDGSSFYGPNEAAHFDYLKRHLHIPDALPAIEQLRPTGDGRTWIGAFTLHGPLREWVVLSEVGDEVGRVHLSRNLTIHGAHGDTIWGVRRGAWDEEIWVLGVVELTRPP